MIQIKFYFILFMPFMKVDMTIICTCTLYTFNLTTLRLKRSSKNKSFLIFVCPLFKQFSQKTDGLISHAVYYLSYANHTLTLNRTNKTGKTKNKPNTQIHVCKLNKKPWSITSSLSFKSALTLFSTFLHFLNELIFMKPFISICWEFHVFSSATETHICSKIVKQLGA